MTGVRRAESNKTKVLNAALTGISLLALTVSAHGQSTTAGSSEQVGSAITIPAGSLEAALLRIGRQTNIRLVYPSDIARGKTTAGTSGAASPEEALASVLAGTGLVYRYTSANTVVLSDPAAGSGNLNDADGSTVLDPVYIFDNPGHSTIYTQYETAAPVGFISQEEIDRFRGADPADIFRGTPGVSSGDPRNNAGGIDVNVRGLQGLDRINVTVDGAENSIQVNQGYQGLSNRTFIDPDFLGGIDILKGSDVTTKGIGGSVAMRTIDASDIVKEGKQFGIRVKGGYSTNSSYPDYGQVAGYEFPSSPWSPAVATPSPDGMDRPGLLTPTGGFGSAVVAFQNDHIELLAGYAQRKRGNYYAGENGPSANPVNVGARQVCSSWCQNYTNYIENTGLANYRAGEEVLNTQLETKSILAKAGVQFGDGHRMKFTFNDYQGISGDRASWLLQTNRNQAVQTLDTYDTYLRSYTGDYSWNPEDNDFIDLSARAWGTDLNRDQSQYRAYGIYIPVKIRQKTLTKGLDIANQSVVQTRLGDVILDYGMALSNQHTKPASDSPALNTDGTYGKKSEISSYAKANWEIFDNFDVSGGIRHTKYYIEDLRPESPFFPNQGKKSDGGFGHSFGVTYTAPFATQFYALYSNALRTPSLVETISTGPASLAYFTELDPERARNWELGVNHTQAGVFTDTDTAYLKLGYFDMTIDNYVARAYGTTPSGYSGLYMFNLDKAKFSGFELAGRYEIGGFAADLAANYYTNVEYCPKDVGCRNETLYGDYSTNQVPPKYQVSLTLSQKLFEDKLTVGGRVTHIGARAARHGAVTGSGLGQFISKIEWDPYTLVDAFAEYEITESLKANFRVENLTDQYYVDPLGSVQQPGPGRTFYLSLSAHF
ncbi:MAG: TonB-dependent receptor [Pseudomonadota bacterium]